MMNLRSIRIWVILWCWFGCIAAWRTPAAWAREDVPPLLQPNMKFLPGPILAAGDGQTVWVARPLAGETNPLCQLYVHPANQRSGDKPLWLLVPEQGAAVHPWMPQVMAMMEASGQARLGSLAVIVKSGAVRRVEMGESRFLTRLAGAQRPVAALGLKDDFFVLCVGPEKFDAEPATQPATTKPATTVPATNPAATGPAIASAPVDLYWNFLTLHDGRWAQCPGLGALPDALRTPGAGGAALGIHQERIFAVWVNADHQLVVRLFDPARPRSGWSPPVLSDARVDAAKVWPVTIGPRTFVFWACPGAHAVLRGGTLDEAGRLMHLLPDMDLGAAVSGAADQSVAVAATGNSIMAVFTDAKDELKTALFSTEGVRVEDATPVELRPPAHNDASFLPGLTMGVLLTLLALSLWQWRQKQPVPPTPTPTRVARVSARLAAAIIDLALPMILVAGVYQLLEIPGEQLGRLGAPWNGGGLPHWGVLFSSLEVLLIVGLYLVHVTVGELFWGRSVGKALCHLRVIALNGTKPTVLAILVRNFVRLFEMIACPLLIYMLMSPNRQRLGDLLARTMVISEEPVEEKKPSRRNNED